MEGELEQLRQKLTELEEFKARYEQSEKALQQSEERFRLIAETIDEIFYIYDVEKDITTYISPAFDRIWGSSREDIINNPIPRLDQVHPDDRERVDAAVQQMRSGEQLNYEYRIIRPDGSIRYLWNRGYPVQDDTGRIKYYVGRGQDVTDQRRADQEIRESREYLNQIINHIGDPVFVKDREHRYLLVNDALCAFAGMPREQLLREGSFEKLPKELAETLWEHEEEVFRTGREGLSEDVITDWKGNTHTILAKKSLLVDNKGNQQIVGVLRDITEYKRLEAQFLQAQKMEAIGVLAGGVAHDFNNLLNVINGYSELVLETLASEDPMRKDLKLIREAGQRAASLTSQLLAFGRKQIFQPEILDLSNVIEDMSAMLHRLIGEDIALVVGTQPNLGLVNADPIQIQQIVMNLAVNARDAMPRGGRLVIETGNSDFDEEYVRQHPVAKSGPYVMLAISDNGVGMDAATQARIFEPFFTTKEKERGTGLGLSTVYGIVKQSNGFIWVYSEPGKGTTFKIYFPRAEGEITQIAAESRSVDGYRGSETVLIAEDEASVRTLAGRILHERGYTVLEASDGEDALDAVRKYSGEIHLVLTDVIMPGISSTDLVSQLKSTRPNIKALYVSGYADNAIVHNGTLDSGVAFLQKPFTVDGLARKVREVLDS